jgi:hypothetical protein
MLELVAASLLAACQPPTATLTVVPRGTTVHPVAGAPEADLAWTITCAEAPGVRCLAAAGEVGVRFAAAPSFRVGSRAGGPGYETRVASGSEVLPGGDCFGCRVEATRTFACGRGLATARRAFDSAEAVIPPRLVVIDRSLGVFTYGLDGPMADVPMPVSADEVPAGTPFRLNALLLARPKGTELVTLRMVGPGIDLSRTYRDDPATTAPSQDGVDVAQAYLNDPASKVRATGPGRVRAWLEFEGERSDELTLTVVPAGS